MTLSRRSLIGSLITLVAAPAIVRVSSLMPVKVMDVGLTLGGLPIEFDDRSNLYGCTTVFYQNRIFLLSPSNLQTVLFSEPMSEPVWTEAAAKFSEVVLK